MQTVDIHTHLMSQDVKFDRMFDKFAVRFFARKFGFDPKELVKNPYKAYVSGYIANLRASKHVKKCVLFGVDAKYDKDGTMIHKDKTVCASNDDVLAVYEANPDVIVPFFSINPLRKDALSLIQKYHKLGFKGAKFLQNYWEVDTTQARFSEYFSALKELNLPLIVHVGNENTISSNKRCESIDMLYHPLKIGVNTICAHMALGYDGSHPFLAMSKNERNFNKEYFALLELLKTHNNLYADVSALLTPFRAKVLRHLSLETAVHEKLLFGSDFPVPYSAVYNSYDLGLKSRLSLHREKNPFDRYAKGIANYFDETNAIWSNYKKILDV
ncbi:hypothetical protein LMG7974_01450 [Campylobacter majalis]|uniref:Amidohydrolase-related domain-containing protein n=1 Tax=Campylobacter majalis TaxID=2790656 RepID=A0ABM8Q8R8_9BACT|nr:amidohydrolase family protein [Campylobacter majalis]CAD7289296.1 hypothetical protein LMG7974_01450 [Campylobacter majalis]